MTAWLELLDTLHALVERGSRPPDGEWGRLFDALADRIGAEGVRVVEGGSAETGSPPHTLRMGTCPTLEGRSRCDTGFSTRQAADFRAFCEHLHAACALQAALRQAQLALQDTQATWVALPAGVTVLGAGQHSPPAALAEALRGHHALTVREVTMAWHLAWGRSLKQQSRLDGRSVETLRTQRRSVCRKLGVKGQHEVAQRVFDLWHRAQWQAFGMQACRSAPGEPG